MLATVTGLQGGAHNGLGKGFGGLLGGFTIEYTKVGGGGLVGSGWSLFLSDVTKIFLSCSRLRFSTLPSLSLST